MRVARSDRCGRIVVCARDEAPPSGTLAARETPEGYLRVEGRINGCGVYEYESRDGERWGELRLPEHVGREETLRSWELKALTDDHPPVWLDADNTTHYSRGTVGPTRFESDGYTYADIMVKDAELIAKIRAGKCELSCGYTAVLEERAGVHDGRAYDWVQTSIEGNHVSVVDEARGGPLCSLIFDGASREQGQHMTTNTAPAKGKPKNRSAKDATIMVGEETFEVPDALAAYIAELEAKATAPMPDADEPGEKPEEMMASNDSARLQAQIDTLRGQLESSAKDFASKVDARVRLVATARDHLGAEWSHAGKSDQQVHAEVLAKLAPWLDANGKSPEYLAAAFETALGAAAVESRRAADSSGDLLSTLGRRVSAPAMSLDDIYNANVLRIQKETA